MKCRCFKYLIAGLAVCCTSALYAETLALSAGEQKVLEDIAEQFADLLNDEAETTVQALRTGDPLSYVIEVEQPVLDDDGNPVLVEQTVLDADGNPVMVEVVNPEDGTITLEELTELVELTEWVEQTIMVENTAGPMGIGNIKLALGLAESTLPEGSSYQDLVTALFDADTASGILDMRSSGMGWGEIYQAFDLKPGEIMREKNSAQPDKASKTIRATKTEKIEKMNRVEKAERVEKPEKPPKPERPVKPEKPEKGNS